MPKHPRGGPVDDLLCQIGAYFRPKPPMTVCEWAEAFRFLPKESSSRPGKYRTALAPYQRGPMEDVSAEDVTTMVLMFGSQLGKTEILNNIVGYFIDYDPAPILMVQPTVEFAESWSKERLAPSIRDTAVLRDLVKEPRARESQNTILHKVFPGGSIAISGANAPMGLAGRPRRVVLLDEVDRYPASAGTEGDPCLLAIRRTETYPNAVIVYTSTPTNRGSSRIESEFEQTDKRQWHCRCPRCQAVQILRWRNVKWPKDKPEEAAYECDSCHAMLGDPERLAMVLGGEWRPTAAFSGKRGYYLSGIYTPFRCHHGFKNRLHEMAAGHIEAQKGGRETLKTWVNTFLAETWYDETEKPPDWQALMLRRESYDRIPEQVVYLTAGVDVQNDRIEYEIVGWGDGEESWGIETGKIFGNPFTSAPWGDLDALLLRTFDHPCGAKLRISVALIDSGGQSDNRAFALPVYRFCRRRQGRYVFACKGSSEIGAPLVVVRIQKNQVALQHVGTDVAKSTIYERLECLIPGPLYCHFPQERGYDEEYFKQLTAESIMLSKSMGEQKRIWKKMRARNEALDMRAYALAAFEIRSPNLKAIGENLRKQAGLASAQQTQTPEQAKAKTLAEIGSGLKNDSPVTQPIMRKMRRRVGGFVGGWQ